MWPVDHFVPQMISVLDRGCQNALNTRLCQSACCAAELTGSWTVGRPSLSRQEVAISASCASTTWGWSSGRVRSIAHNTAPTYVRESLERVAELGVESVHEHGHRAGARTCPTGRGEKDRIDGRRGQVDAGGAGRYAAEDVRPGGCGVRATVRRSWTPRTRPICRLVGPTRTRSFTRPMTRPNPHRSRANTQRSTPSRQ